MSDLTSAPLSPTDLVESLQQDAGLADRLGGDVVAAGAGALGRQPGRVPHRQTLARVDDVDDGCRPDRLQVLQVGARVAPARETSG